MTFDIDVYDALTGILINYDAYIICNKSIPFTVVRHGGSDDCQFSLDSAVNGSGDSILGASYNPTYGDDNVFYISFPSEGKYTITFSAKDTDNTIQSETIIVDVKKKPGITSYSELVTNLSEASQDENNPSVIQLAGDIDTTATLTINLDNYVVLDLNGMF